MLDMVGYTTDNDLADRLIVEPACGAGAFVEPILKRLSASCHVHGRSLLDAVHAVEAFDLLDHNVQLSQELATRQLLADGWKSDHVDKVVQGWIRQADYLLADHEPRPVDFVVANPPYIRLEDVPTENSRSPVKIARGAMPVDRLWLGRSYQDRFAIFCERLVSEGLYDAVCYITSSADNPTPNEPMEILDWRHFSAAISAQLTYLQELGLP